MMHLGKQRSLQFRITKGILQPVLSQTIYCFQRLSSNTGTVTHSRLHTCMKLLNVIHCRYFLKIQTFLLNWYPTDH